MRNKCGKVRTNTQNVLSAEGVRIWALRTGADSVRTNADKLKALRGAGLMEVRTSADSGRTRNGVCRDCGRTGQIPIICPSVHTRLREGEKGDLL
jgi:hypothetical protein